MVSTLSALFTKATQKLPKAGEKQRIGGLKHALMSAYIAELSIAQPQQLLVVILSDPLHVNRMQAELAFFGVNALVFSDWETLIYDRLSPHQDITSERLALLSHLPSCGVLLTNVTTFAQRIAPPSWLLGQCFHIKTGDVFEREYERNRLVKAGYHAVDTVYEAGEFAIRGSLVDIFPMGQPSPIRIDLFDNDIESIKFFDVETQRTTSTLDAFELLPAREFPLVEHQAIFKARFAETFPHVSTTKNTLFQDVIHEMPPAGIEYYLPLFFEEAIFNTSGHLSAYLPSNTLYITPPRIEEHLAHFLDDASQRYEDRRHNIDFPLLSPTQLFINTNQLGEKLNQYGRIILQEDVFTDPATPTTHSQAKGISDVHTLHMPAVEADIRHSNPLEALHGFILKHPKHKILLVAESAGRREHLRELVQKHIGPIDVFLHLQQFLESSAALGLTVAPIDRGVHIPALTIIVENQIFGHRVISHQQRRKSAQDKNETSDFIIKNLSELTVGAPVVHIDHGIGRYAGLILLETAGITGEFLQINYAGEGKVYVPVTNLHLVSRYAGGDPDAAPLHQLGTDRWNKEKTKALEKIHDVAAELLDIEARRNAKAGIRFNLDENAYAQFAAGFPFEETVDQATAIAATLHDMQSSKPMDRLICGDVGFGKTEVAMRAAFAAVHAGYQVAVLVPTTLLAQQHFENFSDRFADWPIKVGVLSRFGSAKTQQQTIQQLAEGQVDIIIGTHKLLQSDIQFKRLGLMMIDEEHRFGVRDKERIKAMRANVDMLTLTATPIPRTLNMAFSGMRDLSIISTPPARRLSVKTFVMERSIPVLKEAILRELLRGGQVYVLHNDVDTINRTAEEITQLIPEARVAIAHGQMRERELERVTQQFYHKAFNVLVCTTIIETGIDIPSANTIIIERADKLGLAQLHQLRGRVGRSHHQAYAYLLVPSLKGITGDAAKRLEAIERASDLGAGFILATEDLEIRGAGEILGEEQSGNMNRIGFSLYMTMLEKATKAIKQGKTPDLNAPLALTADINLGIPALLPDDYIHDVHQRLMFYKRISNAQAADTLDELRIEMIDRFGNLPHQAAYLFKVHHIRLLAEKLGIERIVLGAQGGSVEFAPDTPVEAITMIQLLQKEPNTYRMEGGQRLKIKQNFAQHEQKLQLLEKLLHQLMPA